MIKIRDNSQFKKTKSELEKVELIAGVLTECLAYFEVDLKNYELDVGFGHNAVKDFTIHVYRLGAVHISYKFDITKVFNIESEVKQKLKRVVGSFISDIL